MGLSIFAKLAHKFFSVVPWSESHALVYNELHISELRIAGIFHQHSRGLLLFCYLQSLLRIY